MTEKENHAVIRRIGPAQSPITPARETLARNLRALCEQRHLNSTKLAKLSGVSQRAVHNMLAAVVDPYLGNVDRVAAALGLEVWQLLLPETDVRAFELWHSYAQADAGQRRLIELAVETVSKEQAQGSKNAPVQGGRDDPP